jgi:colicin import membrane protein
MAASTMPGGTPPKLSATARQVLGKRREPGKLPAAMFALVIHAGFFALIVFGVSWQVKPPAILNAEIWRELPDINAPISPPVAEVEPKLEPKPESKIEPPAPAKPIKVEPPQPLPPSKVDIALNEKKVREEKLKIEQQKRDEQKRVDDKKKAEEEKIRKADELKRKTAEDKLRAEAAARDAAIKGARDKAIQDYAGKVAALIRNRANIPESVTGKPIVEVKLRLLVNGAVLDAQIVKASGNRAFDDAVERAINGISQWPLPDDASILGGRRELILRIEHER